MESTIRLFPYFGLVLKYHTGKGVSTKIHSMGRGYFSRFLAMWVFPGLLCGAGRLVEEFRPDGRTSLGARNRTRNLPHSWRIFWRRVTAGVVTYTKNTSLTLNESREGCALVLLHSHVCHIHINWLCVTTNKSPYIEKSGVQYRPQHRNVCLF